MLPRIPRSIFWMVLLFTLVMAILPHAPELPGHPSDKMQHIAAFLVLTLLARAAYPETSWVRIIIGLAGFGALIEFIQAIPELHRDSDWADWVADLSAVLAAAGLVGLLRWLFVAGERPR